MADFEVRLVGNAERVAKRTAGEANKLANALKRVDLSSKEGKRALREFTAASNAAARSLRAHTGLVNAHVSAKRASERLYRREQRHIRKASGGSGFGGLAKSMAAATAAYVGFAAARAVARRTLDFAKSATEMFQFAEGTRLAFSRLRGGAAQGEEAFQRARDLANELGLKVTEVAPQMKQLLAQQFSLERSSELIKLGADLRVLGNSAEDVQGAMRAIAQISAKGKLQQEELLQLAERGISLKLVRDELKKTYGVNDKELEKLQRKGGIGGDAAIDAIQRAILKKVGAAKAGDAGKQFAKATLSGAINAFGNRSENFLLNIVDSAQKSFKAIAPTISALGDVFNDSARVERFAGAFNNIGEVLKRTGPKLVEGFAAGLDFAAGAFERITKLGGVFFESFIGGLSAAFPSLRDFFKGPADARLIETFQVLGNTVGRFTADAIVMANKVSEVINVISGVFNKFADFIDLKTITLGEVMLRGGHLMGFRLVEGLVAGLAESGTGFTGAIARLAQQGIQGFRTAMKIQSPSRVFAGFGNQMQLGLAKGLDSGTDAVRASASLGFRTQSAFASPTMPTPRGNFSSSPVGKSITSNTTKTVNNNHIDLAQTFGLSDGADGGSIGISAGAGARIGIGQALGGLF